MPPYPTGTGILQLLGQQGQRRAALAQQLGQIAAETQARNGQIWGNTLAQLGQLPMQIYQQRAADQEMKLRQAQEQRLTQQLQDQEDARTQAKVGQAAIGSFMQGLMTDSPYGGKQIDPAKLQEQMLSIQASPELQQSALTQATLFNKSNEAFQKARLEHMADQADLLLQTAGGKPIGPDQVNALAQANVAAGVWTPREADQANQLAAAGGADLTPMLQRIRGLASWKYKAPTPEEQAKTAEAIANAQIATRRAEGMSPEGLLPKEAAELELSRQNAERQAATQAFTQQARTRELAQGDQRLALERQRLAQDGGTGTGGATAPGLAAPDPNAPHGDDYLKTLPENTAAMVKSLAEGRQPWPTAYALRTPYWQGLVNAVLQYDPSFDTAMASNNARMKLRQDFTSGKSAQQVNAINTVVGHLSELSDKAAALGNSPIQFVNTVKNWVKTQAGAPEVTNFNTAKKAVADELTRVWRQAGGAEADIKTWQQSLDAANSPSQLNEAFKTIGGLLESKLDALQNQYQQGMGISDIRVIAPTSRQSLDKLEGRTNQTKTSGPNVGERRIVNGVPAVWDGHGWKAAQ